jgi:hypothetical protein
VAAATCELRGLCKPPWLEAVVADESENIVNRKSEEHSHRR